MNEKYSDKPIYTINKNGSQKFITGYFNSDSKAVISLNDSNTVVNGNPKISIRLGNSDHGEELILELLRTGDVVKTTKNSNHDGIEIYLPKKEGLNFIKEFIKFAEETRAVK